MPLFRGLQILRRNITLETTQYSLYGCLGQCIYTVLSMGIYSYFHSCVFKEKGTLSLLQFGVTLPLNAGLFVERVIVQSSHLVCWKEIGRHSGCNMDLTGSGSSCY